LGRRLAATRCGKASRTASWAPNKLIKIRIDVDVHGYPPEWGDVDRDANEIEGRLYNTKDFNRTLVVTTAPSCRQETSSPPGFSSLGPGRNA
jgi:hypothetical protein